MTHLAKLLLILSALATSACSSEPSSNQAASADQSADQMNVDAATEDAMAAADAALANAGAAIENASGVLNEESAAAPVAASSEGAAEPSYSTTAYCEKIGETAGGSSVIERSCRDMEADALTAIRGRSIPSKVHGYCDTIGETAGGSYVIYNTCVDMELEAASTL